MKKKKEYLGHFCYECVSFEYWRPDALCGMDSTIKLSNNPACIYFRKKDKSLCSE